MLREAAADELTRSGVQLRPNSRVTAVRRLGESCATADAGDGVAAGGKPGPLVVSLESGEEVSGWGLRSSMLQAACFVVAAVCSLTLYLRQIGLRHFCDRPHAG